jgi:G3E family GTPase
MHTIPAGKTSLLSKFISQRPQSEYWAVFINEFGALGLDAALLEGPATLSGGLVVREFAGGCMCCMAGGVTTIAITQLIRQTKPHRLWIEPSGLANPTALLATLTKGHLQTAIDLQQVLCLVDITLFMLPSAADLLAEHIMLTEQLRSCTTIVGSKGDLAGEQALAAFKRWATENQPGKKVCFSEGVEGG